MKFNKKYLSIPPYISTSWSNVNTLHMSGNLLVITLSDGSCVHVPDLDLVEVEQIFEAHANSLESDKDSQSTGSQYGRDSSFVKDEDLSALGQSSGVSFKMGAVPGLEGFGAAMQHNIEHANAPDLPKDILQKIASIATIIAPQDVNEVPQPEPHCNCPHCQIARAINEGLGNKVRPFSGNEISESQVEEVPDEELVFQQWEIQQAGDQLFVVVNKLDEKEKYNVFLGEPIGCTCGKEGCEHIVAVLQS